MRGRRAGAIGFLMGALALGAPAQAIEPSALPEAIWWRTQPVSSLRLDPLEATLGPGSPSPKAPREPASGVAVVGAEWAPLYRGSDGSRFVQASRTLSVMTPPGVFRAAAELESHYGALRGGDGSWWVGAERPRWSSGVLAVSCQGRRIAAGAALGASAQQGVTGLALEGRARVAPGWSAGLSWSRWPERALLSVRWKETRVVAAGRWLDQRLHSKVTGSCGGLGLAITQESMDRSGSEAGMGDRLEPALAWRASTIELWGRELAPGWRVRLEHGEGREAIRASRGGTSYAAAAGPVASTLVTVGRAPTGSRVAFHGWAGRCSGAPQGVLALWPFEELGAISGARRVARTSAVLEHQGLSVDRDLRGAPGWEAGMAAWILRPRADFQSWQATLLGLGHDDAGSGATSLRSVLALGARAAAKLQWGAGAVRLEVIQWVPARIVRSSRPAGSPSSVGTRPVGESGGLGGKASGGAIVRFSIESAW